MNLFTEARAYIDARIKAIDPDLEPWEEDAFNDDDSFSYQADKFYKLAFGTLDSSRIGNEYREDIPFEIQITSSDHRDVISAHDDLYCKGIDIKNEIIQPQLAKVQTFATDILANNIEVFPEETGDKAMTCQITLTLRRDLKF